MAQTIWIHKLADAKKADADGMDYICEHLFQALMQSGKLTKAKGWNPLPNASAKDGTTYRALFCDSCGKNYNNGNVRMAKDPKAIPTYPNQPETKTASSWDQKAAATYLDQRQGWSLNLIEICFQDDASFRVRS